MRAPLVIALSMLSGTAALAQTPDVGPVVAAERAFAADAPALGIAGSFNKWSTPDAILIGRGQAQPVGVAYPDRPRPADEPLLEWWPNFAGVAQSGEMGFTTGGVQVGGRRTGHYFTVWMRQPDGAWRWVYDGGSGASAADVPGPEAEPVILPVSTALPIPAEQAMSEVREIEHALAVAARQDQRAAHLARVGPDSRVYVAPRPPAIGPAAIREALTGWPATFEFGATEGGGASQAGDMAWTYGPAAWIREGQPRTGHYVRLWQRRAGGWTLVLAQLIPAPPPPASAAAPG